MGLPDFTDKHFEVGDRVEVEISGRTGTIVRRCAPARDGWIVKWDEPVFGVAEGRVATVNLAHEMPRLEAPDGMRWANGGGSVIGGCNGWHLAPIDKSGTLCGLYGPHTIPDNPKSGTRVCGNCARIAKIERVI